MAVVVVVAKCFHFYTFDMAALSLACSEFRMSSYSLMSRGWFYRLFDLPEPGLKPENVFAGLVQDTQTGAIWADNPAPGSEPLYYYEVTIISKDRNG